MAVFTACCAAEDRATAWQALESVADVHRVYPERLAGLLEALDLDHPGLGKVKTAAADNPVAAGEALLDYYRTHESKDWARQALAVGTRHTVERFLYLAEGKFRYQSDEAVVPRFDDGHRNWNWFGPADSNQYAQFMNRHSLFMPLLQVFQATGDDRFAAAFDEMLRDWCTNERPPVKGVSELAWGYRLRTWKAFFFAPASWEALRPATRILMLASLPGQVGYLRGRMDESWLASATLSNGVAHAALCFPEFQAANDWLAHANRRVLANFRNAQFLDGISKQNSSNYHMVSIWGFDSYIALLEEAGSPVPEELVTGQDRKRDYLFRSVRPNRHYPQDGDSGDTDRRGQLLAWAEQAGREDWLAIATDGERGVLPAGNPSAFYPYAGKAIFRSGWDARAQWSFFDNGPYGTVHGDSDVLHLSVFAHGRDLLVDTGRTVYGGEIMKRYRWNYAKHASGHNVVLLDGRGIDRNKLAWSYDSPKDMATKVGKLPANYGVLGDAVDIAQGRIDDFERGFQGKAAHRRAVFYRRGRYWLVIDRVETDRERVVEALWHLHPACTAALDEADLVTTDADLGNLRLRPIGDVAWQPAIVKGQLKPRVQGWYFPTGTKPTPSPTAVYRAKIPGTATWAWLITTGVGPVPRSELTTRLEEADGVVTVVLTGGGEAVTARWPLGEEVPSMTIEEQP